MIRGALLVIFLLQGQVPHATPFNFEKLNGLGESVAAGTTKIDADSGIVEGSSDSQELMRCRQLKDLDATSGGLCLQAVQERLTYSRDWFASSSGELRFRKDAFEWQLFSSKIVFVVVLIVVFSGLIFAAIQFYQDHSAKIRAELKGQDPVTAQAPISTVAIGKGEISVSSPVLGVIVLTLSITFLYLYLQFVYPIHELAEPDTSAQAK